MREITFVETKMDKHSFIKTTTKHTYPPIGLLGITFNHAVIPLANMHDPSQTTDIEGLTLTTIIVWSNVIRALKIASRTPFLISVMRASVSLITP